MVDCDDMTQIDTAIYLAELLRFAVVYSIDLMSGLHFHLPKFNIRVFVGVPRGHPGLISPASE